MRASLKTLQPDGREVCFPSVLLSLNPQDPPLSDKGLKWGGLLFWDPFCPGSSSLPP